MADGLNNRRASQVAELLSDFRALQYYIAAVPVNPPHPEDYYTEGWTALRQCAIDGQHILNCAAETSVPVTIGGQAEQEKAELRQVLLDAYSRRHEAQKIHMRQLAIQRWIGWRDHILQGHRPHPGHLEQLAACDMRLRGELVSVTDETIYADLQNSDNQLGRWTLEDPNLSQTQNWLWERR